jgi:ATP-binding cassette, subfamily F, member 3
MGTYMSNMLQISNVSKRYGQQVVLDDASFCVGEKKKIAVVGRNGAGKSTLFNVITGQESADSGEVVVMGATRIGYLKQEDDFQEEDTVLSYLLRESECEDWQCRKIASQFELKDEKLESLVHDLSGGYQMRVKLSLMLLKDPNLILLDEPTNYLDLSTMLLLEKFLINYRGAYLIISHDRRFIANTCQEVVEIDRGRANYFPNTLEMYFKYKKERQLADMKFNKKQEQKKEHLQKFIDRFGAKASKAAQAKSKAKAIEKIETVDIDEPLSNVRMRIANTKNDHGFVWRSEDLTIGYGEKEIARDISIDIEASSHIAVLGDNGQGKSTFLKTLAKVIEPVGGELRKQDKFKVAYYAQHVTTELDPSESVFKYLERSADHNCPDEEIYKLAANFLFTDDDLAKPISVLSGGEKSRLCLAGILLNKNDVLLLDEPTNHLDFETAEVLAHSLAQTNVTILFISHDRTFINILADRILEVKDETVRTFYGKFVDYVELLLGKGEQKDEVESGEVEDDKTKEFKKYLFEEKKKVKRELGKIEKVLNKLKKEQDIITRQFAENPTVVDPELSKRLGEVEEEIKKVEDDWMKASDRMK